MNKVRCQGTACPASVLAGAKSCSPTSPQCGPITSVLVARRPQMLVVDAPCISAADNSQPGPFVSRSVRQRPIAVAKAPGFGPFVFGNGFPVVPFPICGFLLQSEVAGDCTQAVRCSSSLAVQSPIGRFPKARATPPGRFFRRFQARPLPRKLRTTRIPCAL